MDIGIYAVRYLQGQYSRGNFEARFPTYPKDDEIGAIMGVLNRLGEKTQKSMMSRDYLSQLLNALPEMVFILDAERLIIDVNEQVGPHLGYLREDCFEKTMSRLHGSDDLISAFRLRDVKNRQEVSSLDNFLTCADGRQIPVHVTVTPLSEPSQKETGIIVTAEDTSQRLTDENNINI
jgi:PAS domain S-box-containing protein